MASAVPVCAVPLAADYAARRPRLPCPRTGLSDRVSRFFASACSRAPTRERVRRGPVPAAACPRGDPPGEASRLPGRLGRRPVDLGRRKLGVGRRGLGAPAGGRALRRLGATSRGGREARIRSGLLARQVRKRTPPRAGPRPCEAALSPRGEERQKDREDQEGEEGGAAATGPITGSDPSSYF